jgi:hypothetical protein
VSPRFMVLGQVAEQNWKSPRRSLQLIESGKGLRRSLLPQSRLSLGMRTKLEPR